MDVINEKAVRYLYGENSGITALDCTKCTCIQCGKLYIEVFPDSCLDTGKRRILTVDQAKNLGIWDTAQYDERVFCDTCRKALEASNKNIMEIGGFLLFLGVIVVLTVIAALGGSS